MKRKKGSAISQYAIIIALIAIVLIPLLIVFGGQINKAFQGMMINQSEPGNPNQSTTSSPITPSSSGIKPGSLGGTPSKPVEACDATSCNIDYGSYVLSGIPLNFGSVIESAGSSGGMDKIVDIMLQIAQSLEDQGNTEGAKEFRDFANLTYFEAKFKKALEDKAKTCSSASSPNDCFYNGYNMEQTGVTIPANVKSLLPDFSDASNTNMFSNVNNLVRNDYAKNVQITNPDYFESYKTQYPPFAMVELYNSIQNQTKASYPPEIRTIATRLYQSLSDVSFESSLISQSLGTSGANKTLEKYNLFTGASETSATTLINETDLNELLKPNYGSKIDLRAALLCVTGQNYSDGKGCQ